VRSSLNHSLKEKDPHRTLLRFYQELIRIRREFKLGTAPSHSVRELEKESLLLAFQTQPKAVAIVFNFSDRSVSLSVPELSGDWTTILESSAACWSGQDHSSFDNPPSTNYGVQSDFASTRRAAMDSELILSPRSFHVFAQNLGEAK
jgi:hypothetical protein